MRPGSEARSVMEVIAVDRMEYDAVVVGGGAAGLTAALVMVRARRRVAVVDAGEPRNAPAAHVHGFLSRDGTSPADLLAAGRSEVVGYGGEVIEGRVRAIDRGAEHGFVVQMADNRELATRSVLVTTGLRDELPEVPGVRERWGTDVLHCPYCHGYEVRDAPIGVLGGLVREMSMHQAFLLGLWSHDVIFFPNQIALAADERERLAAHGIQVADGHVAHLVVDDDRLAGVALDDGCLVARTAVFVSPRFVPHDELLRSLGCQIGDDGWVTTDVTGRTSVPGVWAAGNVVDPRAQVISAAAAGSTTGIAVNGYLLEEDIERSVAAYQSAVADAR